MLPADGPAVLPSADGPAVLRATHNHAVLRAPDDGVLRADDDGATDHDAFHHDATDDGVVDHRSASRPFVLRPSVECGSRSPLGAAGHR